MSVSLLYTKLIIKLNFSITRGKNEIDTRNRFRELFLPAENQFGFKKGL